MSLGYHNDAEQAVVWYSRRDDERFQHSERTMDLDGRSI